MEAGTLSSSLPLYVFSKYNLPEMGIQEAVFTIGLHEDCLHGLLLPGPLLGFLLPARPPHLALHLRLQHLVRPVD